MPHLTLILQYHMHNVYVNINTCQIAYENSFKLPVVMLADMLFEMRLSSEVKARVYTLKSKE